MYLLKHLTNGLIRLHPQYLKKVHCLFLSSSSVEVLSKLILNKNWKEEMIDSLKSSSDSDELLYQPNWDTKIEALTDDCDPEYIENLKPPLPPTFNLAAYANHSQILQEMIKLGVDLFTIEKSRNQAQFILSLDFEKDVKNHLLFLHDNGVEPQDLGHFITLNPFIFSQDIQNLKIRIQYLEMKRFSKKSIARIIAHNPRYLSYSIKEVDNKLGTLQREFKLSGNQIRAMLTTLPTIVNIHKMEYSVKKFTFLEEMSFNEEEIKQILVSVPSVLESSRPKLVKNFDYLHFEIGIEKNLIKKFPEVLILDNATLSARYLYLKKLKKDQFNPTQPGYIPLKAFASCNDQYFIENYCKTSVQDYNHFLKTL